MNDLLLTDTSAYVDFLGYADDTTLLARNSEERFARTSAEMIVLKKIECWAEDNRVVINPIKLKTMNDV